MKTKHVSNQTSSIVIVAFFDSCHKLSIENQGGHAHPLGAGIFKFPGQTS